MPYNFCKFIDDASAFKQLKIIDSEGKKKID